MINFPLRMRSFTLNYLFPDLTFMYEYPYVDR